MTARDLIFGYRIEGLGPSDPSIDRTLRFSSDLLPDDPDGVYRATLVREAFDSVESSADFRGGAAQTGGISFSILLDAETLYLLGRTKENALATLTADIDGTTTTIPCSDGTLAETVAHIGRETILLGATYTAGAYTGSTRGYRDTETADHRTDLDPTFFRTMHPSTFYGRVVTFFLVPRTGSYADEVVLQQFIIQEASLSPERSTTALNVECLGILDALRLSRPSPDQWRGRLDTSADRPGIVATNAVSYTLVPEDVPGVLARRSPVGDVSNFTVEIEEKVYLAEELSPEVLYQFDVTSPLYTAEYEPPSNGAEARQVWINSPLVPSGSGLGYDGPIWRGDAITVALNLLTSAPGSSSPYSLDVDFGIRLPGLALDVEYCENIRAVLGNEIAVPNFVWGREEDEDAPTLDLIEQKLLAPFLLSFGPGPNGGLAIVRLFDAAPVFEVTPTIDTSNLRRDERVGETLGWDAVVSEVTATYDDRPGVGVRTATAFDARLRTRRLGKAGEISLDMGAIADTETVQNLLGDFAGRWRNPTPVITYSLHPSDAHHVGIGANLFFPGVLGFAPDHGGYPREGVKDSRIVVKSRRLGLDANSYEAYHVGLRYDRTGRRAASAGIIAYDDPTATFTVSISQYVRSEHPVYTQDIEAFQVKDVLQWRSGADGTLVASGLEITAITAPDQIEIAVSPGAIVPGPGDVILNETYASSTADQTERHAYFSDTAGEMSDASNGYQYQA